jgi:hypothetical protein
MKSNLFRRAFLCVFIVQQLINLPTSFAGERTQQLIKTLISNSGYVSSGNTSELDRYRKLYSYTLGLWQATDDIVGMGIAGSNDHVYVWNKDGTVSSGTSWNLDRYRPSYGYTLAPGKTTADIVGIGIAGLNDHVYVWYKDGTVSSGTTNDLDRYRPPYGYTLAPGKTTADIAGMGISRSDKVYVWYR